MNSDLISRRALIKAIKTECNPYGKPTIDFESGKKVLKIIDNASPVGPELSDEQIEKIADLLETEWGYEGIREDVSRILKEDRTEGDWIPIKTRELTEKEKEEYPDCTFMYDCKLPEDGDEVLITTWSGQVALDTFYRDDGCYFETYCDEEDVIAWQPKPEPYKKGDDGE